MLSFYLAGEDPDLHRKWLKKICTFDTLAKLDENYETLEGLTYNDLTNDRQFSLASYTIPCTISKFNLLLSLLSLFVIGLVDISSLKHTCVHIFKICFVVRCPKINKNSTIWNSKGRSIFML